MSKRKRYALIFLLSFTCLVYNLPYLSNNFYQYFVEAFTLTNEQRGLLLTMFGLAVTPGYLFGGLLADKFSPKKLLMTSLLITALIGFAMTFLDGFPVLMVCYFGFGISTTFIHWSAMLKLVREQAAEGEEGKVFGFFECCYGIVGAVTSYGVLAALGAIIELGGFRLVTSIYAVLLIIIAIFIAIFVKDVKENKSGNEFNIKMVGKALAHPVTWLNGLIVMGMFMFASCTTYFNPYLSGVFGVSAAFASGLSIANNTILRIAFTPLGGVILDRLRTPKFLVICSLVIIAMCVVMIVMPQAAGFVVLAVALVLLINVGSTVSRPALYTPIPEAGVPLVITGTAMGICSAVGYSTDLWLHTLCGSLIDKHGNAGYQMIVGLMIVGLVLTIVCAVLLGVYEKRHPIHEDGENA